MEPPELCGNAIEQLNMSHAAHKLHDADLLYADTISNKDDAKFVSVEKSILYSESIPTKSG